MLHAQTARRVKRSKKAPKRKPEEENGTSVKTARLTGGFLQILTRMCATTTYMVRVREDERAWSLDWL